MESNQIEPVEPIEKLYERAKKALLVMKTLDRHQTKYDYDSMLSKLYEIWGGFLDRLVFLDAIKMFADSELLEKDDQRN